MPESPPNHHMSSPMLLSTARGPAALAGSFSAMQSLSSCPRPAKVGSVFLTNSSGGLYTA